MPMPEWVCLAIVVILTGYVVDLLYTLRTFLKKAATLCDEASDVLETVDQLLQRELPPEE